MTQVCGRTSIINAPAIEPRCGSLVDSRITLSPSVENDRLAGLREKQRRAVDLVCPTLSRKSDFECRIGRSRDELFAAFALVYQQYRRAGLMNPNAFQMRITPYHLIPTTEVLIALHQGTVSCTMSLVCDGDMGLPMETVYPDEIAQLRLQEFSLAEVSCLAERYDETEHSQSAVFQLMPLMAQLAYRRGVDFLMIAVHPRHARFYRRVLGFDVIAEERSYGKVCGKPAVALAGDLNRLAANNPRVHQWLFGEPFPHSVMAYKPVPNDLLAEMETICRACLASGTVQNQVSDEAA